ncbi:MAG: flavin reductase [Rhodoferax sp.]|nr:flavin reductase [Rhodoferax sp.]
MKSQTFSCVDGAMLDTETAYRLVVGCVVPRPVAWITSVDADGRVNAAPFSSLQLRGNVPAHAGHQHCRPTRRTRHQGHRQQYPAQQEFVVNVATEDTMELMHQSAQEFPPDVSEIETLGIALLPSRHVAVPRIAIAPVQMECRLDQAIVLGRGINTLFIWRDRRFPSVRRHLRRQAGGCGGHATDRAPGRAVLRRTGRDLSPPDAAEAARR